MNYDAPQAALEKGRICYILCNKDGRHYVGFVQSI